MKLNENADIFRDVTSFTNDVKCYYFVYECFYHVV